jgi:hypothetical protein
MVGRCCVCKWQNCSSYSEAFKKANHILDGQYFVVYGQQNMLVRKLIEKHLRVDDDRIEGMETYTVAYHHWPEQLVIKNKDEGRSFNKVIYRSEAVEYGPGSVELINRVDHIMKNNFRDDQKKMYVQAPVEAEKKVSTMVAMFTSCRGNRVRVRHEIADKKDLVQKNIKTEPTASIITPMASSKYDEDDCCVDVSAIDYLMDASPFESPMKVPSKPVDCCVVPP